MKYLRQLADFLHKGIWEAGLTDHCVHARLIRYMRILILAYRNFIRNDSIRTASILTYYSVLNFVPLVAVVFAIAKGFGLRRMIQSYIIQIADAAHLQPEMANQIIIFSNSLLKHARGGVIAGIGTILLLWTVISILGKIEDSFNSIWEVNKPRTLMRKLSDYMSILFVVPILFAVSASASVLLSSRLKTIIAEMSFLGFVGSGAIVVLQLLPYLSIWALLIVLYIAMPNKKVSIRSGLLAGLVAGTGFQVIQLVYLKLQIGISSYGAIYGGFAAVPLFLGWLEVSWIIVLFGAEIAHAAEHSNTFGFYPDYSRLGRAARRLIMLRVLHLAARRFQSGTKPLDAGQMALELKTPIRLVEDSLEILRKMGLIIEVVGTNRDNAFQPAKPVENMTIKEILDVYDGLGDAPPPVRSGNQKNKYDETLRRICTAMECRENTPIRDL